MDTVSQKKRSWIMAQIKASKNRSTESKLLKIFRAEKISGWRRNFRLNGKPDFVFPERQLAIFVDGCFWHYCPKCYRRPSSRREYWDAKILRNKSRDRLVTRKLRLQGWRVLRIWEHELLRKNEVRLLSRIHKALENI